MIALLSPLSSSAQFVGLGIAPSNSAVVLFWCVCEGSSLLGTSGFALETRTNLSPGTSWTATQYPIQYTPDRVYLFVKVPATNAQQFFRLKVTYPGIFQYAIFYNNLLEFTWCSPLTLNGRVQANANIYTGSDAPLTFNGAVSTAGSISSPAWDGHFPIDYTGAIIFYNHFVGNTPPLWTFFPTNIAHAIIDIPPASEQPDSAAGIHRLYNLAQVLVLVSNATTTVRIRNGYPGTDPTPVTLISTNTDAVLKANFPFLTITNSFTDQREDKTVLASQIDVGKYAQWIATNPFVAGKFPGGWSTYPTILYVADLRSSTSSQLTAVRLTNGIAPPANGGLGFTVATPNPLYVWGNYNCTNPAYLGTSNTSATVPCALMSDALTILSPSWRDSQSSHTFGPGTRVASDTTVNAAILPGIVPSTGPGANQYSGGFENLSRLLEDWGNGSSATLTLNGSFACLYASMYATNQFQNPGAYYYPPVHQFSFDQNFLNSSNRPPGTPWIGL